MNWIFKVILLMLVSLALLLGGCEMLQKADEKLRQMTATDKQLEEPEPVEVRSLKEKLKATPHHDAIEAQYQTIRASNVRGGPGTNYVVIAHLKKDERVWVKGKVRQRNWYIISQEGQGDGYLHTSLVKELTSTALAGETQKKETLQLDEKTQLPSGKLSAGMIGNLLIGNTVTLVEEITHQQSIEYYQANTNELIHYENSDTSDGHWKITGSDVGQFCRYWLSGNQKTGRCYYLFADGDKLHFLPVFKPYGVKRRIFIDSMLSGNQIETMNKITE